MIGMMYLVLTALLALNVSKEIINAFVTIDDALNVTVSNLAGKNAQAYQSFEKEMKNDPTKTKPYYDKALKVKTLSDDLDIARRVEQVAEDVTAHDCRSRPHLGPFKFSCNLSQSVYRRRTLHE